MEDAFAKEVLNNAALYQDPQVVLEYRACRGVPMTSAKAKDHHEKRKKGHIAFGGFYSKKIYNLANIVQAKLMAHKEFSLAFQDCCWQTGSTPLAH